MKTLGSGRRSIILLIVLSAYIASVVRYVESPVPYQNFVWYVLLSNLVSSILLVFIQSIFFLSTEKSRVSRFFRSLLLLIPIVFFHFVIGGLLSFFAQMEPLHYFGPNGFINNFNQTVAWQHLVAFSPMFGFYLFKKMFFFDWSISRKLSGAVYFVDPLLALVCSVLLPLLFMKLGYGGESLKTLPELMGLMMFIVMMPWEIFFNRDVIGLHEEGIPVLCPEKFVMPLEISRYGVKGWGAVVVVFGLVFVSAGMGAVMIVAKQGFSLDIIGAVLVGSVFMLMGMFISLIGINIQFAERKVTVTTSEVFFEQSIFIPKKLYRRWSVLRSDYLPVVKEIRLRRNKNRRQKDHLILLKRKIPVKKFSNWKDSIFQDNEVILYQASFADKHDEYYLRIRDLLGDV